MRKLLEKEKLLKGVEKMDKKKSLAILDECIQWLENASDLEIKRMQEIYHDEKKSSSNNDEIELLFPVEMKAARVVFEEKFQIEDIKILSPIIVENELKYVESEFNEAIVNEWEDFAAQENKVNESKFKNPVLEMLQFVINQDFDEEKFDGIAIEGTTQIAKLKGENAAFVELSLEIGEKSSLTSFWINITMKAEFKWEKNIESSLADKLLKSNAPSLLLSYMRPIIANVTGNSAYPAFNIPYMDMAGNEAIIQEIDN